MGATLSVRWILTASNERAGVEWIPWLHTHDRFGMDPLVAHSRPDWNGSLSCTLMTGLEWIPWLHYYYIWLTKI